ncbi:MAG: hypothetical protein ACD_81C00192G0001 [uncultured bacterium]|uniref:ABC transporter, ATP-binding/permease protein n=1 Tax=Candidatus Wolfebacteria bacterium GW2011_GWE2_44_13 TaxID=1619017 RepID=A0A0G1HBK8_9BACT|nr:MAG: hypothetical protein ACD_81C00192G0001 [uncultured bacterium]KKT43913.1 MAG: ABC transporter, ATP-binding/permease protein [Candidatus Wolfebacteria bacterium GW2011_GWE2_44_13]
MEEDKDKKLSFGQFLGTLRWLVAYNIKLAPTAAIVEIVLAILIEVSPVINAYIFALLLDDVIRIATTHVSPNEIFPMLGLLLSYNLFISAAQSTRAYFGRVLTSASSFKSPMVLYKHIHALGIQTLENPEVVNKIQRAKEMLGNLSDHFRGAIEFIARIVVLIVATAVVIKIMPWVVLVVFVAMIPGFYSNKYYVRKHWQLFRRETENRRRANSVSGALIETVNLQEITITSAYKYLSNVFKTFADRYAKEEFAIIKRRELFGFSFKVLTVGASIFGYFSIFKNFFSRFISIGDVTFQMRSLDIFVNNFSQVGGRYSALYEQCMRISEVKEVFDMKSMVADGNVAIEEGGVAPSMVFKGVNFKYPNSDRYVINGLDLEIKSGEKIAIVGENGAGKTTLVKLLSRFYKVEEGGIYLNDENINNIKIDSWYKKLGVLFQDYNTYGSLTLKENILLGDSHIEPNEARMKLAASRANVSSFIDDYTNGYDQVLDEKFKGGTRPSTGQWQKIAIARFFYRNSPVVIFDEPTASIDAVSEAEIFGQIYEFFKDKTVITISHRFSTVRNADKIYVMDNGSIAESGSHEELMALKGKYHNAFTIQAEGYK